MKLIGKLSGYNVHSISSIYGVEWDFLKCTIKYLLQVMQECLSPETYLWFSLEFLMEEAAIFV